MGEFPEDGFVIPGSPENNDDDLPDIALTLRYSVNDSFEWIDFNGNGELDWYLIVDANKTEITLDSDAMSNVEQDAVVDMGTRGFFPYLEDMEREYQDTDETSIDEDDTSIDENGSNQIKIGVFVFLMRIIWYI